MLHRNKKLTSHFSKKSSNTLKIALISVLSVPSSYIIIDNIFSGRPLTHGEIKLSQSVFKSSIDYSKVFIHNRRHNPFQKNHEPMAPNGKIYYAGKYLDDFSKADNYTKSKFVHEMTHIWQYQNNILNPVIATFLNTVKNNFDLMKAYKFNLTKHNDLIDYGVEQQARIIESRYRIRAYKCTICIREKQFDKVLMNFYVNPSYANRPSPNTLMRVINSLTK